MKLIDNKTNLLIDELKTSLSNESIINISCNFFTSFALFEILDLLLVAKDLKLLISPTQDQADTFKYLQNNSEASLNITLNRRYKVKKALEALKNKVQIRRGTTANQNIIIIENPTTSKVFILTPMNLDSVCIGTIATKAPIYIHSFEDPNNQYLSGFKQAWENSKEQMYDFVQQQLEKGLKKYSPESIYKYSIREIFHYSAIEERADEKLQKVGFKDSKIWSLLYNFQKDAVIGAIEKIETYGGCIIADSVGLGKTFEALGIMKYYSLRNKDILVLAPKKLRENWTVYAQNDKRNILAEDRLRYDVLNHTDLSRTKGKSGDIDLETINWGNYDLVVIDESHNFRNNPTKRDGLSRYKRLMNDVIKSNIKTKVLMLSATPVNNKMNDLKNQISFITEGIDNSFESFGIPSIAQIMRDSQRRFTQWFRDGDPEKLDVNELMGKLNGQYFRILDMLTIARSRKHIEKYYDTADIGKFPDRLTPITVKPPIDTKDQFMDIGQIYDEISTLTLASYMPLGYVRSDKRDEYEARYDMTTHTGSVFKQVDREQSLIYLMRVNLLKRLESSINSFKLTTEKLIENVNKNLKQVENHINGEIHNPLSITEVDIDDTELEDLLIGGKIKVLIQDIDLIRWKQDLKHDKKVLTELLSTIKLIDAKRDAKLLKLKKLIVDKLDNPINNSNKKVIIFTAFADTAKYLYGELSEWLKNEKGIYSGLVTGGGNNKTNMPNGKTELNALLSNFSPKSKKRDQIYPNEMNEVDILFCTDCISEGQNLQDCDYLVNYDIHWNPVRIIQRFGRIDRIGSTNESIQLVNFFPSMELDSFIDLVAKVQGRMVMLDVSATGEDNIISKNSKEMQDLDYRKQQLKQLQNQVIDIEDVQGNISITDLTFNDFKIDLEKSSDEELKEIDNIPPASFAVVRSNLEQIKPGAIFCLKDTNEDNSDRLKQNIIHPFFLVYLSLDGSETFSVTQTKLALDYFRKLCMGKDQALEGLVNEFEKQTKYGKNMIQYQELIKKAITAIIGEQENMGLDSLASVGGTSINRPSSDISEQIELVSYLIIK